MSFQNAVRWGITLIFLAGLFTGFFLMLQGLRTGQFDPRASQDKAFRMRPAPAFRPLLPLQDENGGDEMKSISPDSLKTLHSPILLTFFASWCAPCIAEMPELRKISGSLPLWGVVYRDSPEKIREFLKRDGNPFSRIGLDPDDSVGPEWGITGVPESFLIGPGGKILWHVNGMLTETVFKKRILPLLDPVAPANVSQ